MTPAEREHTNLTWQAQKAENENIANMNKALLTMFLAVIQPAYKKSTKRDLIGRVSQKFSDVFDMLLTKYGKVKPMDLEANRDRMKAEWDPEMPIETLFGKIKDAR